MPERSAEDHWQAERTTFQRVYDVIVGSGEDFTAGTVADRAACSETGAREALAQLCEMGIAEQRGDRPVIYRRNDAYLTWRRVDELAREHDPAELRQRVDELLDEDDRLQARFDAPEPDAVVLEGEPIDDHEAFHERWEALGEWRTVRRDIRVLRRAVQQAEASREDRANA